MSVRCMDTDLILDGLISNYESLKMQELVDIPGSQWLTNEQQHNLDIKYRQCDNDVAYIYYTGECCNHDYKHTILEFCLMSEKFLLDYGQFMPQILTWPVLVAVMGACVVWKDSIRQAPTPEHF